MESQPNALIHASSPYLLQHAYNPVYWQEWGPAALAQAKAENKLLLVSIGYSACHWCHVMEHESFENFEVAEVMNKHFVCVKIDREERPDIDQIYMLAVQLMGINGGWPLNCICLPDQRPIYGGTYFKKNDWISILENVAAYWANEPENALDYASRLAEGIAQAEKIFPNAIKKAYEVQDLRDIVEPWKRTFDMHEGGYNRSPKFPLPNNWQFLLRSGYLMEDEATVTATLYTLEKMAMGGIYDQIGGGFARYSVDDRWHVPHFEKMLYDNAQLISLYAEAYQFTKFDLFKQVATGTIAWVKAEMTSPEGLFYSALDADSEGIEGKFYVWQLSEVKAHLGEDAALIIAYYNITEPGNWEEEHTNILLRRTDDASFAADRGLTVEALEVKLNNAHATLLAARSLRVRPGLDDKCLTAWNAMMIKALADASQVLNNDEYYTSAVNAAQFILDNMKDGNGGLFRNYKNGNATIMAFLDDYAFTIDALIALYQCDFNEKWLLEARKLTDHVLLNFIDVDSPMLFYTSIKGEQLIARKHEIMDNVIPAANSVMARNLHVIGLLFNEERYTLKAVDMLASVQENIKKYGSAYSNWATQMLETVFGINEIVVTGNDYKTVKAALNAHYIPNKIMLGGTKGTLPLLENKAGTETKIYICRNKTCSLPVGSVQEALDLIN